MSETTTPEKPSSTPADKLKPEDTLRLNAQLTPSRIVEELDKYIIGQTDAKKAVAIALRNRWRRLSARPDIRKEIMPNNILMIGATGIGKTEIARRLAQLADAPFIKVEASKFTEVGYVGRDVESMIRDLVENAVNLVREERRQECFVRAREAADERILDILLPYEGGKRGFGLSSKSSAPTADNGNAGDEQYNRTRDKFREKLKSGELEERQIEVELVVPSTNVQVMGPMGQDQGMDGLQDMLQNMMPKKRKKRKMRIIEAREVLTEQEVEKLIDMDAVQRDALNRAQHAGIVFIDEIDKVAARSGQKGGGVDVSREGVQRDLLPVIEGTTVNTKHGAVKTDHMLFIAAGAFHVAKPSDLIPELQGRLPIRVELQALRKEDFVLILKQPENALTKQYQALLESEGVKLSFDDGAIDAMAELADRVNQEVENIGARRLHTIMSNLLDELLFEVPDKTKKKSFKVTADYVQQKLAHLAQEKDMSHYIL